VSFHQWVIDDSSAGGRVDLYLTRQFSVLGEGHGISRAAIQRLIGEGQVTINGQQAKSSSRVKVNDRVTVIISGPRELSLEPEALPLEVLYQDADCLVINKAPGVVVHPAAGNAHGTLVHALLHHCPDLQGIGGARRPGIVHRLDKDTSGAMIVAKNMFAFQELARQFKDRVVDKQYLALAWGRIEPAQGIIDRPIGRHRTDRKKMSSLHAVAKTRVAVTEWCVEKYFAAHLEASDCRWVSLLKLKLHTGRTHQLRVHLADQGYPIVGDKIYNRRHKQRLVSSGPASCIESFPRQALHAETLKIRHVRTGQPLAFNAPLPDDLESLLRGLETANKTQSDVADGRG